MFADLLPTGDWQLLADRLYSALRDGLAHGFDTKHLFVDGKEHQIFLRSDAYAGLTVIGDGLLIGLRPIAEALCAKIDNYESLLAHDAEARKRFVGARQKKAILENTSADDVLRRINYDFDRVRVSLGDRVGIVVRAKQPDRWVSKFYSGESTGLNCDSCSASRKRIRRAEEA